MKYFTVGRLALSVIAVIVGCSSSAPVAAASGGNSAIAKLCQKGGWQAVVGSNGTSLAFPSQDACVSYGASGGALYQPAPITGHLYDDTGLHTLLDVTGTGFTPNHSISFTSSGFVAPYSGAFQQGTVLTNGDGAFTSDADQENYWFGSLGCRSGAQTIHITATDGVHLGVTDVAFAGC